MPPLRFLPPSPLRRARLLEARRRHVDHREAGDVVAGPRAVGREDVHVLQGHVYAGPLREA